MPLYEYQCKQCGHRFEKIQTFSAAEIKECPVCAGEVEKLISAPAIQFKGSGWYVSDYGRGGAAGSNTKPDVHKHESNASSSEGKGDSASGASGAGEAKPAAASSSSESGGGASGSTPSAAPAATSTASTSTASTKKD